MAWKPKINSKFTFCLAVQTFSFKARFNCIPLCFVIRTITCSYFINTNMIKARAKDKITVFLIMDTLQKNNCRAIINAINQSLVVFSFYLLHSRFAMSTDDPWACSITNLITSREGFCNSKCIHEIDYPCSAILSLFVMNHFLCILCSGFRVLCNFAKLRVNVLGATSLDIALALVWR